MTDNKNTSIVSSPEAHMAQPTTNNSPESLLALAITSGANIDTIERFMALRDKVNAENAKNAYITSMARFQSECPTIEKTKVAKDGKGVVLYKYAPLETMVEAVAPLLVKHQFSYTWKQDQSVKDEITVKCVATHALGHSEESELKVSTTGGTSIMSSPQKVAAALTFAKRYTFASVFGIVSGDEDVDGKREEGTREDAPTEAQREEIDRLLAALNVTKADFAGMVRSKYGISITQITKNQAVGIIEGLTKKLEKAGGSLTA